MPSAPKKIINLNKPTAVKTSIKKAAAPKHTRADGSYGNGIHKKDKFGKAYYTTWSKDYCPPEYRMLVWVTVDAAAEKMEISSGLWTFDKIKKYSLLRLREIQHYCKFGAQLKLSIPERQHENDIKKGMYCADWVDGSDRTAFYSDITPSWAQEQLQAAGIASPEVYHDRQRAIERSKFE